MLDLGIMYLKGSVSMNKTNNYLWGLLFILLGIILGINALGLANIDLFFDGWWCFIIIIPCFINLFNDQDKVGNAIGLLIGILLLLSSRNIIDFSVIWKLFIPIVLVLIGISIMFKDKLGSKVKKSSEMDEYCATFGEQKLDFSKEVFEGCDLSAIFGSIRCDIEKSKIKDDIVINSLSLFGSVSIIVPSNVKVVVKGVPIFGSIKNNRVSNDSFDNTIYINATCVFGGIDIR